MDADGFTVVSKKKAARRRSAKPPADYINTSEENVEDCLRKIIQAREDLEASEGYSSLQKNLNKIKSFLQRWKEEASKISSIVCYGLGQVSSSRIARYQTGLLMSIQEFFDVGVEVFDPAFSSLDERVLDSLNFTVVKENEEGKKRVLTSTLFYMPHCGKELYNNLLWANWNAESLPMCVIIGNSFSTIVQNVPSRILKQYYNFIERAEMLYEEYPLKSLVEHDDVFNDISIHIMKREIVLSEKEKLLEECIEPDYTGCEAEIVRT
ncbi:SRR1-like protein [Penaeus chinensis]|uniref:SRR1-like protein n=1 Tax=Penaeus chinensis TaxID=139456 RepID=UPI001FB73695|nr:SRR1-like protein [Penaeus chinensis]XP_047470689.1 SRR1-like protein [Penaeus chinensis]